MKPGVLRFRLALFVFFLWISWLAYLTFSTARPIVLSRPQFLVSNLVIIADIQKLESGEVTVLGVHWPQEESQQLQGKVLKIVNLAECQRDWTGPGPYIVPLLSDFKNDSRVAPLPPSPGFSPHTPNGELKPRIYPLTPRTMQQLDEMQRPEQLPLLRP